MISRATEEEPLQHRIRRAAARFAEWLVLGALALIPPRGSRRKSRIRRLVSGSREQIRKN
jgi:hypothetical protein